MNEVFNSITEWWKEKTTSPLYGTFIFSVILWNWKFFYVLFWQDQSVLSLPKIEYVEQHFLNYSGFWLNLSIHFLWFLILPAMSTYIIIWWIPLLTNLAHKVSTQFYFNRKGIFDDLSLNYDNRRLEYEHKQKRNMERFLEVKKEQIATGKKIEHTLTDEDRWRVEFTDFLNNS